MVLKSTRDLLGGIKKLGDSFQKNNSRTFLGTFRFFFLSLKFLARLVKKLHLLNTWKERQ